MAYVKVDSCTKGALCIDTCPVDCVHPKPGEPAFETAPRLSVDPEECMTAGQGAVAEANAAFCSR